MNETELAIIQQIAQLDEARQKLVLEYARNLMVEQRSFNLGLWLESAQKLQAETVAQYGENFYFNTQEILDEIREEASY